MLRLVIGDYIRYMAEQEVGKRHDNSPTEPSFSRSEYELSSVYEDPDNPIENPLKEKPRKSVEQKYNWIVDGVKVSH
jgi:hypothetical protein